MEALRPSPPTTGWTGKPRSKAIFPSIKAKAGGIDSVSTARRMASPVAPTMFSSAISATLAKAMA